MRTLVLVRGAASDRTQNARARALPYNAQFKLAASLLPATGS